MANRTVPVRKRRLIRTTKEQRNGLALIKKRLALQGFHIFPVVKRFRRHSCDFLAVAKESPQKLLLIQAHKQGTIRVRPYLQQSAYYHAWMRVECGREPLPPIVWGSMLPAQNNAEGWRRFIPEEYGQALALFTNAH